jgi:hypothetical protein
MNCQASLIAHINQTLNLPSASSRIYKPVTPARGMWYNPSSAGADRLTEGPGHGFTSFGS